MNDFMELTPEQMTGASFECVCGLTHKVDIERILTGKGVLSAVCGLAEPFAKSGRIYMVSDNNTFAAAGEKVLKMLQEKKYNVKSFIFQTGDGQLNPDEKAIGRLLYEVDSDISLMIAVGSGVMNDLCRTVSHRLRVPFIIAGTAPSMDGYASRSSPLIIDGFKLSSYDSYPMAIVCDTDILKDAPYIMLQAGFGDIIGKVIAISDWNLSRILTGEHYCDICAGMMQNAVKECIDNIDGIVARDEKSIGYLTNALISAGVAMAIYTSTRPASSVEHYFAHYWDTAAVAAGHTHPLHGNSVGVGTVIACDIYEYMKEYLPEGFIYPKTDYVKGLLGRLGASDSPKTLGISRELFIDSVFHCVDNRPRFGILHLAQEKGLVGELADHLSEKYYG